VEGRWSDSVTGESGYVAKYVNDTLAVIEEQMTFTDGMRSSRAYYYDDRGALTRIVEDRRLMAASGNSTPTMLHALLNVYLSGYRIDSATKTVDLDAKPVQPYDIENLRQHEREIFARVPMTYTAPRTNR
jgi:hypothetical protein